MIRKCILYPSHVDILLQYHDIISARRVPWGEKIAWRVWRRINKGQLSSLLRYLSHKWIQGKRVRLKSDGLARVKDEGP